MSTSNTTTKNTEKLARWLEANRAALLERWQAQAPELQHDGAAADPLPALFDSLVAATLDDFEELDRFFAHWLPNISSRDGSIDLPHLLQLPFTLRHALADLLSKQRASASKTLALLQEADPIFERAAMALSHAYSEMTIAELNYKVREAEVLATRQALLAEEADRAALKVSSLYEISRALSSSLELRQLLVTFGDQLRQALDIDNCAIWLINRHDPLQIECQQAWGNHWAALYETWLRSYQWPPALRTAISQDQPLRQIVEEKEQHGAWSELGACIVYVPLKISERPLGCLVFQHSDPERFGPSELRLAEAIGNQAAVALEKAFLYSEIREINVDLEEKVAERASELQQERDRLQTLFEIGHYITSTLEIDDLLQRTLQALAKLAGVEYGSVMLLEHDTGHLVQRAVLDEDEMSFIRLQVGEGIAGWIAQHREPVLLDEVRTDPRWVEVPLPQSRPRKEAGSLVGVPLVASDEVVGVLMLSHPSPHYFHEDHLALLRAIAGEIAIAIYNAQLYGYLNERAERFGTMMRRYEEEASKINAILQSLADGVIVCGNDGFLLMANLAAQTIIGRPLDELLSTATTLSSLLKGLRLPPDIRDPVLYVLEQPQRKDGSFNTLNATMERGHRTLSVHLGPVTTERGELLGAVAILRDITREVESDRIKTEFIATVSHELRTPMTSIKGYTQLLPMLGEINQNQREFLSTIAANADRMIAVINDLLDITKVETGSVDLNLQPILLPEVLGEALGDCQEQIDAQQHSLSLELQPTLPPALADAARLRQILFNLILNACKYTPQGGRLTIGAKAVMSDEVPAQHAEELPGKRQWVLVSVQDSGVGIDSAEHEKIFERFYRSENPLKVEAGGTGLGLSLVHGLVKLLGGRIWVTSQVDHGSTFFVLLPSALESRS